MYHLEHEIPEKVGVSSKVLVELYEELEKNFIPMKSLMIMRNGKVITNGNWTPYTEDLKHIMYSTSKSITALAVGFAIEEKLLKLDDKLVSFFPELITAPQHEFSKMRTIKHLLTMTDGQLGHPDDSINRDHHDWLKSYLNSIPKVKPGTLFGYNNSATIALSAIIQKVTGLTMMDYLEPRLFQPLGIKGAYCQQRMGIDLASRGIHIKTEDMIKIGQLMLQKGRWNDVQVIPEHWINKIIKKHVDVTKFNYQDDGNPGYGYHWWRYRDGSFGTKASGGQAIICSPKHNLVFAYTANQLDNLGHHNDFLKMIWPFINRSLSDKALEEDPNSYTKLKNIEGNLEFPIPSGITTRSHSEDLFSNSKYIVGANEAEINDFTIKQTKKGLKFNFSMGTDRTPWEFEAGFSEWIPQKITVTDDDGWVKYVWRNKNVLECIINLKNKLGSYRLIFYVENDHMALDFYSVGWRDFNRLSLSTMAYQYNKI